MDNAHCFISYSNADGLEFATKLADELEGGYPFIKAWFEKREMVASGDDWDDQLASAISSCKCFLFVMSVDSTAKGSNCKEEWAWALKYKKPVICLLLHEKAEDQYRLNSRQKIDFTSNFDAGTAHLRTAIARLDKPEGQLDELRHRLADANRDLRRAKDEDKLRIQADIDELSKQIENQQKIVENPQAAKEQTQRNIDTGLERERQPEKPVAAKTTTKFINPPPGIAPTYFQDRVVETEQVIHFLQNPAQRMMTVAGRGGVGKTAMVCRLLKHIESGDLPDGKGRLSVDGIVYLSETGTRRVNFPHIFEDLSKLLLAETANKLESLYKDPKASVDSKTHALLEAFPADGHIVLLLDNFESVVDAETQKLKDAELDEALRAILHAPHHAVKVLITTRVAPRELNLLEPARQRLLTLDEGLDSPYAEQILRQMDEDGKLGLKTASDELLKRAKERTRGYPRALEALFAILSSDRYTTLEELLNQPTPDNVVEALVGEAFSRLDPTAQKVMQALAIYNRPVAPAAVDYLLQPHIAGINSAPVLNRLTNMHFVRRESGRFYLHPVDKEYAVNKVPEKQAVTAENVVNKEVFKALKQSSFSQHDLLERAADYFKQARKPRAEWNKLDDLAAQLAEFDLRCAAGDYDTAADLLHTVDRNYLGLWGHYHILIREYEQVVGKIVDSNLARISTGDLGWILFYIGQTRKAIENYYRALQMARESQNRQAENTWLGALGAAYSELGETRKAIEYYEQALLISREIGDQANEGVHLGNLASTYADLGNIHKSIEYLEQALVIDQKISNRRAESADLGNLGVRYFELGESSKAIEYFKQSLIIKREIGDRRGEAIRTENMAHVLLFIEDFQLAKKSFEKAIQIADEISLQAMQQYGRWGLSQAYLFQNDLVNAHATIEAAQNYDVPENNHNASALHGIIALQQGDEVIARQAFTSAIAQADEILAKTAEYYSALDAKGLAVAGLLVIGNWRLGGERDKLQAEAIETFKRARKIAPHAGVIKSVLRLFDELAKCDAEGVLQPVRAAVEGTPSVTS